MAKKTVSKFRKLSKVNGKLKTKKGKIYQVGDDEVIQSDDFEYLIESKLEVIEHDAEDTLPEKLKGKLKVKK